MGLLIDDSTSQEMLCQLNVRFEPGDKLEEMVVLQKEFHVFSEAHSLRQSFGLLGIDPGDRLERRRWRKFLDETLEKYTSDIDGMNGHNRIVRALEDDLSSEAPLPVYFICHLMRDDPRVTVTQTTPLIFSLREYVVISIPTRPRRVRPRRDGE